ncbi:MAG: host attachment protein [Gammaproteobacteria bacterium]|nr:host attachment protein [Gammaproteobacteria bacterium]
MHLNGKNTWVVVADSSACRIYEYLATPESINLVREVFHPESHLKDIDFKMDRDGSYHGAGGGGNYVSPDPKENTIDKFSRDIAKLLDDKRKDHAFKHLIIITPPHLNGKIHLHMNKHVKKMVNLNIPKDLIHYKDEDLLRFLHARTHVH